MIFRRKEHRLPKFPPNLAPTFRALCEVLAAEEVQGFVAAIDTRLSEVNEQAKTNPRIDSQLAAQIAERCKFLCGLYPDRADNEKSLIVGAVRYFALAEDALDEEVFASGFHDDAKVVNHVLEELGDEEHYILL